MFQLNGLRFLCLSLFVLAANAGLAPFIEPCKWDDDACVLSSSKKAMPFLVPGIPELGMPSLDPLVLNDINGDNAELKLHLTNMGVEKLSHCDIKKSRRSEKLKYAITIDCPILANGDYVLSGKLLFIDVEGTGKIQIETKKVTFEVETALVLFKGKDGKQHYKFGKFDFKYIPIEKFYIKLDNLYNGDAVKAEPVNKILDENWKEIITDIGKPIIKEVIVRLMQNISNMLRKLPADEIELN